ncbi:MAG TPA: J domain-containing protein [Drouetiella sp.]
MSWNPPPQPKPQGSPPPQPGNNGGSSEPAELSLYQLLHVDRDAHVTIIRYAYRFLAAQYHPDNGETGDAEKFRVITDAWKTLSDEGKRAAYDMSLGAQEQKSGAAQHKAQPKVNEFGRDTLPTMVKAGISWNEIELRIAILQVLLAARKKKPATGGASGKMLMDCLQIENITEIEFALWYLREKHYIETGERVFMITGVGLDYLTDQLSKTQILEGPNATEKKVQEVAGLPAVVQK